MEKGRIFAPVVLKQILESPDTLCKWDVYHRERLTTSILEESAENLRFIEDILLNSIGNRIYLMN